MASFANEPARVSRTKRFAGSRIRAQAYRSPVKQASCQPLPFSQIIALSAYHISTNIVHELPRAERQPESGGPPVRNSSGGRRVFEHPSTLRRGQSAPPPHSFRSPRAAKPQGYPRYGLLRGALTRVAIAARVASLHVSPPSVLTARARGYLPPLLVLFSKNVKLRYSAPARSTVRRW